MLDISLPAPLSSIPITVVIGLGIGCLVALALVIALFMRPRRREEPRRRNDVEPRVRMSNEAPATFRAAPLLDGAMREIHKVLEDEIGLRFPAHRLMVRVSLGDILEPVTDKSADASKDAARRSADFARLDFAVFDEDHKIRLGIVCSNSEAEPGFLSRREAMRAALDSAGVPLIEMPEDDAEQTLRDGLTALVPADRPRLEAVSL